MSEFFPSRGSELCCEGVPLGELAERFGTPLYVYSKAAMVARFRLLREAFGESAQICFAVKSNPNRSILRLFAGLGAGFDLVSGGELRRLQAASLAVDGAVFAGVGKQKWEVREALEAGLLFFNLEAPHEVDLFEEIAAELDRPVPIAVRLNPDVDALTHEFLTTATAGSKFGLDLETAGRVAQRIVVSSRLELVGLHVHLGSQVGGIEPYLDAFTAVERFLDGDPDFGSKLRYYDLGGGFRVHDGASTAPLDVASLAAALLPRIRARGLVPVLEPGRFLVAEAGVLLTRVLGRKRGAVRDFLIVDAAMNDLLRPSLYGAEHPVVAVQGGRAPTGRFDVVGPVCESADFMAKDRELPELVSGEVLAVLATGAYGAAMASNYNSRPRPAEVLVNGTDIRLIRRRERIEEVWAGEIEP